MSKMLLFVLQHGSDLSATATDTAVLAITGSVFGLVRRRCRSPSLTPQMKAEAVRKATQPSLAVNSSLPELCRRVGRELAGAGPYGARAGQICSRLATLSETD